MGEERGEVMGKWDNRSLHGRRKSGSDRQVGKTIMQVGDREAGTNLGERRKQQLGSFMGLGELGLGHGLGSCKRGEWVVVSYSFAPEYPIMFWLSFLP